MLDPLTQLALEQHEDLLSDIHFDYRYGLNDNAEETFLHKCHLGTFAPRETCEALGKYVQTYLHRVTRFSCET